MRHFYPRTGAASRAVVVMGLLLAGAGIPRVALADARSDARAHFTRGMSLIADARYEDGIQELTKAYEISPHPNVVFNIARAYAEMGDLPNAIVNYQVYLEGNPPDRAEVQQVLQVLETRMYRQLAQAATSNLAPSGAANAAPSTGPSVAPAGGEAHAPSALGPGGEPASSALPAGNASATPADGDTLGDERTEDVFEETVVTASKGAQSPLDAPASASVVTAQDIRLSGITQIPELLRRLAGVDVMEVTAAQPELSIRGFNRRLSNRVLVLVDGRSTMVDLFGNTFWPSLTIGVEDIERIEVVRGPVSSLYGADAMNGVINIITRAPGDGPSGASGGYGDHRDAHGSLWASGREGKLAWRMSAGYDYRQRWSRESAPGRADVQSPSGDPDEAGRGTRLDLRVTRDLGRGVTAGLGGGLNRSAFIFEGEGALRTLRFRDAQASDVTGYVTSKYVEARVFWNDTRTPYASLDEAYVGQSLLPFVARADVVDGEVQFKDRFETGEGINHDLRIGLNYRFKSVAWTYQDSDRTENHGGFYAHDQVSLGRYFSLAGDYRVDYSPYLERFVQSARGAVLVHPTKRSTVRAIVANGYRAPSFLESYLNLPQQLPQAGGALVAQGVRADDRSFILKPEQALSTELGYTNQDSNLVTFDGALFYDHTKDLIDLAPGRALTTSELAQGLGTYDPASGLYPVFYGGFQNQCQAYDVLGAELGLRTAPIEGLDLYANYTLMGLNVDDSNCSVEQKALSAADRRTSTNKVNAGVALRTKIGIDASVDFHFIGDQTWSEQVSDRAASRIEYQSFHLDAYTLLNARLGYRFPGNHAEVSAMAWNILGTDHREHPFGELVGRRSMAFFTYRF